MIRYFSLSQATIDIQHRDLSLAPPFTVHYLYSYEHNDITKGLVDCVGRGPCNGLGHSLFQTLEGGE